MDSERDEDKPLERVQPGNLTARVPEGVAAGVFATGAIVLQSPTEVMIDFVQGVANPRRVAVRVVLSHAVAVQFAEALESNLLVYESSFGHRPSEPRRAVSPNSSDATRKSSEFGESAPADSDKAQSGGADAPRESGLRGDSSSVATDQPPIADAYAELKATDEVLGGAYANTVTIAHTGSEFHLDFINRCFPRSIVNARVYLAAPRAPALLASLRRSLRIG